MSKLILMIMTLIGSFTLGLSKESKIESVVFDYGGVLSDYQRKEATEYLSKTLKVEPSQIRTSFRAAHDQKGQTIYEETFWNNVAAALNIKLPLDMAKKFRVFLSERLDIHPEMKTLLKDLKSKKYGVYLLSNQSFIHYKVLKDMNVFDLFDDSVVSHVVKASKPDPKIYEIFIEQTKLDPTKCLFIDDKLENLEAAKAFGFQTLHFDLYKSDVGTFKSTLEKLLKK